MTAEAALAERLREMAGKATPGEWRWRYESDPMASGWYLAPGILIADGTDGTPGGDELDRRNAAWLEAASPSNIVALLDALSARIAELEKERDEAREWANRWHRVVETILTIAGLSPALSADEAAGALRTAHEAAEHRIAELEAQLAQGGEAIAFVDEKGEVWVREGSPIKALMDAVPQPPVGKKLLPLYAAPLPASPPPASSGTTDTDEGRNLARGLADAARALLSRPPGLRGPFKTDEEALRRVAALGPRTDKPKVNVRELVEAPPSATAPASSGAVEATCYVSEGQLRALPADPADECGAGYLPVRHKPAGNFQLALFASPAPSQPVSVCEEMVEAAEEAYFAYGSSHKQMMRNALVAALAARRQPQ